MSQPTGCLGLLLKLFGVAPKSFATMADYPYGLRDAFLSPAEVSFYHVLKSVLPPNLVIAPKVRLADILFVREPHLNQAARNRVQQKHVDFLLCDAATVHPRLVIELDDASHAREDRQTRDGFVDAALMAAGLPFIHMKAARGYTPETVRAEVTTALG